MANGPNRPFGISFLGRAWSEEKLVQYACAFEAATQVRNKGVQPYFVSRASIFFFFFISKDDTDSLPPEL